MSGEIVHLSRQDIIERLALVALNRARANRCENISTLSLADLLEDADPVYAAQAVLDAAVTWETALTAMMPGLIDGDPMLADPLASRLYNAIRRYREARSA